MFKLWAKTMTHPRPPYTPRAEYQCDGSTTHYQGCKCHEARRDAELAAVTKERDEALKNEQASATAYAASRAECAVLRGTLEGLAKEAQGFIKCHEWEIRSNAGNSNIAVMEARIKLANEALVVDATEDLK